MDLPVISSTSERVQTEHSTMSTWATRTRRRSPGVSKIRRIRYTGVVNQPPIAAASANPTSGAAPLNVSFSSAGSSDPEGQPLTYLWTFGDGTTSSAANPSHTYLLAGPYTARLSVSRRGKHDALIDDPDKRGGPPTGTILSPVDAGTLGTFKAGDVISFSGSGTDPEDGILPASAFTWNIDLLHDGHVHPGTPISGVKSGTFIIPASGHDFTGNVRYRFALTVRDSSGLTTTTSVVIWPQKVNLTFNTMPSALTLYINGIAQITPFVIDDMIGFNDTIEARDQTSGATTYTFASWSDGGSSAAHHRGAQHSTDLYRDLHGFLIGSDHADVRSGEQRHAINQSEHGEGHLHRRSDRR